MTDADTAAKEADHQDMLAKCRYSLARDILLKLLDQERPEFVKLIHMVPEAVLIADALIAELERTK